MTVTIGALAAALGASSGTLRAMGDSWNNHVLAGPHGLVFRVPKCADADAKLLTEVALLSTLHTALPVAVPRYVALRYIDALRCHVGVYEYLTGQCLRRGDFEQLRVDLLSVQVAQFLTHLHGWRPSDTTRLRLSRAHDVASWYAHRVRRAAADQKTRRSAERAVAALDKIDRSSSHALVLVHGDFSRKHILVTNRADERTPVLGGVIDFGEAVLGDPARDFGSVLVSCGERFANGVLAAYGDDAGLRYRAAAWAMVPLLEGLLETVAAGDLAGEREAVHAVDEVMVRFECGW